MYYKITVIETLSNHNEIPFIPTEVTIIIRQEITTLGEDVKKLEALHIANGNVKW